MTVARELLMESMRETADSITERTFGIAEYLEILVPIIEGFNEPIRTEHRQMYEQCLLTLHKQHNLGQFRQQLVKAISKFIQKDESLADQAILSCIKYWPRLDPHKEVCSLTELESIFNLMHTIEPLIEISNYLVKRIADSISSIHFSVAERALLLLHSPLLLCLVRQYKTELLPLLVDALQSNVFRNENQYLKTLKKNGTVT